MTPPTDAAVLGGITAESKEYFEKRSLKKGAVNWVLLMSLGIAYVISGDFSGWNYGIGYGGWFGMLIAFLVMGAMYLFMVLGLAEMSSAMPAAGAGYGFARRAMGKVGGALTGFAILIEYTICPLPSRRLLLRMCMRWACSPISPRLPSSASSLLFSLVSTLLVLAKH